MPYLILRNNEIRERKNIKVLEIQQVFEEPIVNLNCFRNDIIVITGLDKDDTEYLTNRLTNIGAIVKNSITKNSAADASARTLNY